MSRVVLDTNVIISGLLFDGVPERAVLDVLAGANESVLSTYIINEVGDVLQRKFAVSPHVTHKLQKLLTASDIVYFEPFLSVLGDDPDNRVLETAVVGKATYIVTGDRLLLNLRSYQGVTIIRPADYIETMV